MVLDKLDETPREHYGTGGTRVRHTWDTGAPRYGEKTIDGWNAKVFQPFFVCGERGGDQRVAFV